MSTAIELVFGVRPGRIPKDGGPVCGAILSVEQEGRDKLTSWDDRGVRSLRPVIVTLPATAANGIYNSYARNQTHKPRDWDMFNCHDLAYEAAEWPRDNNLFEAEIPPHSEDEPHDDTVNLEPGVSYGIRGLRAGYLHAVVGANYPNRHVHVGGYQEMMAFGYTPDTLATYRSFWRHVMRRPHMARLAGPTPILGTTRYILNRSIERGLAGL